MLFVDSAVADEIGKIFAWGVASGVTTNRLLLRRQADDDLEGTIGAILAVSRGPVSVELDARDEAAMLAEAERYHGWDPARICIKIPLSEVGLRVASQLVAAGKRTNVTCTMSFNQAYLAALTGSDFVSIFSGRVRDTGYDVRPTIATLRELIDREGLDTRIVVGSIRQPMDVHDALASGAHIVTVPPAILRAMLHHPKTDQAIAEFGAGEP